MTKYFEENTLPEFIKHYIMAMLWSSNDDNDDPLDDNYDSDNLSKEAKDIIEKDCREFIGKVEKAGLIDAINDNTDQAGHDFWLTRNGHGAGFWDRGIGEVGEALSTECDSWREFNVYVGDDGKIYAM